MGHAIALFSMTGERRGRAADRRQSVRGGRRLEDKVRLVLFIASRAVPAAPAPVSAQVKFGFDAASISQALELEMPVDYAAIDATAATTPSSEIERQLRAAVAAGVTPIGQRMPSTRPGELADLLASALPPDSRALIVTRIGGESDHDERGLTSDVPLAAQHAVFQARGHQVVVAFCEDDTSVTQHFPRSIAAADLLGTTISRSSIGEASSYSTGATLLVRKALYNQQTFRKPTFVVDCAFSSYPEPYFLSVQEAVVRDVFRRLDEFRAAGVQGLIWRTLVDNPSIETTGEHGEAARHWGLLRADGSAKPAFTPFFNGILTEKAAAEAEAAC
jgi:hypothetical protein